MPVSFTAVAGTLNATIVDDNFDELQKFFNAGVDAGDFSWGGHKLTNYHVRRFEAQQLVSVTIGALPPTDMNQMLLRGTFESNYKEGHYKTIIEYDTDMTSGRRTGDVFEFLGKPGKSFFFDFQEDGYYDPGDPLGIWPAGLAGWPPAWWPDARFPSDECWSRWLTVPHAATKIYVPGHTLARVTGFFQGIWNYSPTIHLMHNAGASMAAAPTDDLGNFNRGCIRAGLFVDTNPILWDDEFDNTGANLIPTITKNIRSFQKFADESFQYADLGQVKVCGEVVLKGKRSYNFSLKHRRAGTVGYYEDVLGVDTFYDADWEQGGSVVQNVNFAGGLTIGPNLISPHTVLWLGAGLHIDLNSCRDTPYVGNYAAPEMGNVPGSTYDEETGTPPPYGTRT